MRVILWLLALAYVVQVYAVTASDRATLIGSLPVCAQACITSTFQSCNCPLADFECACRSEKYIPTVQSCMKEACHSPRLQNDLEAIVGFCPQPTSSSSSTASSSTTSSSTASSSTATSEISSTTAQPDPLTTQPLTPIIPTTSPPAVLSPVINSPVAPSPSPTTMSVFGGYNNYTNLSSNRNTHVPSPLHQSNAQKAAIATTILLLAGFAIFL